MRDRSQTQVMPSERVFLQELSRRFPNKDAAIAEIARLLAELTLPKGTVHVISDVHGEDKKLRHVINNASGTLRPILEERFAGRMSPQDFQRFRTLVFYPNETISHLRRTLKTAQERGAYGERVLPFLFELVRALASRHSLRYAMEVVPETYRDLLAEIFNHPAGDRTASYLQTISTELSKRTRLLHFVQEVARMVRNLAVHELIIAGDFWDRGPRGDRVVDYLMRQPHVSCIWGNHDLSWIGACLGHGALLCNVLRISIRYCNLSQLEEGYGIPLQPLEWLAREIYTDDPATQFGLKGSSFRDEATMRRMQKAIAVMQFKLEGQMLIRHPEWEMEDRRLLHRLDLKTGTIALNGQTYRLLDKHFPTVDPADPYALSEAENRVLERLKQSFTGSEKLRAQVEFIVRRGGMYLRRDDNLIFHGCVPVDENGQFLEMPIGGTKQSGRALFDAIETEVLAAFEDTFTQDCPDLFWYLWSGPRSPLFGKDKIATLEAYLLAEHETHHETKNPYFALIHDAGFCEKVMQAFGVDPERGLIVNGHVPVKLEKGESPLKKSGKAITIDGAFSEAYGDHGYTLVLEAERTMLATHHHLDSVESAVRNGEDIVPTVTEIRRWEMPRTIGDTERGRVIRSRVVWLERLVEAYRKNRLGPRAYEE